MAELRPSALVARATSALGSPAEARTLVAHVLGVEATGLLLAPDADAAATHALDALTARRLAGEPLQHLTGVAPFRHTIVRVGPGVFIPRPETEVMTGWVIDHLDALGRPARVVELCAGSGAISRAIATEAPGHEQWAVEREDAAVGYLLANLADTAVEVVHDDMADALPELDACVDVVVVNPPYIPLTEYEGVPAEVRDHDPAEALFSGPDGLDAMRVVARVAARLLAPGGWVAAEHADAQGESAPAIFVAHGAWDRISDHRDLTGRPRFVTARRTGRMAP